MRISVPYGATLALGGALFAIDQLHKTTSGWVLNPRGGWSLPLDNWQAMLLAVAVAAGLLIGGAALQIFRQWRFVVPTSCLAAGTVSNLLDRLIWGGVRDVWQVGTARFNLADVYVAVGVGLTLLLLATATRRPRLKLGAAA